MGEVGGSTPSGPTKIQRPGSSVVRADGLYPSGQWFNSISGYPASLRQDLNYINKRRRHLCTTQFIKLRTR